MTRTPDSRSTIWGLLALLVVVELLYSSRWWPPTAATRAAPAASQRAYSGTLRTLLSRLPKAGDQQQRVWFAPYTTFPETGFVESVTRRGVYDTFLAIPTTRLAANYGATKFSPADTLFSLASAFGLPGELRLARRLGYRWFALDLGALQAPAAGAQLCRTMPGCQLTADAYGLFLIDDRVAELERRLVPLTRRMPLLPQQSAGPSWGPLVLAPLQWGPVALKGSPTAGENPWLIVQALPRFQFDLYRYSLDQYPQVVQPWLRLGADDVQLVLAPDVRAILLCIGPKSETCKPFMIGADRPRIPVGDRLVPGQVNRIAIMDLVRSQPDQPPFALEIRASGAADGLLAGGGSAQP